MAKDKTKKQMLLEHCNSNKNADISLRIGLGLFFLAFGILKFIGTDFFISGPYKDFYGTNLPKEILFLVGIVQLLMTISFFANKYAKWSAVLATAMMASTIWATLPKILEVFTLPPAEGPPGFLFFSAIPLFFMSLSLALKEENK